MLTTRLICHSLPIALVLIGVSTAAAEENPPARTMRVQVLGPDDKPLQGAKVHSLIWAKDPLQEKLGYVCDGEGKTVVALPKEVQSLRLWTSVEGHVALFADWGSWTRKDLASLPEEHTFNLKKGTLVGGIVKNDDGEPIAGAKVEVMLQRLDGRHFRPIPNTWLSPEDATRITDAEGRWTLNSIPAGEDVRIKVMLSHPKYLSEYEWGTLQDKQDVTAKAFRDQTAVLVMHNGVPLSGTVVDVVGKGIAGAVVVWGDKPRTTLGSQEVFTDADGRFQLPPLPIGPMNVTVVAPGWSPAQRKVEIGRPDHGSVRFNLEPGKKLRIRFVDLEGNAIPDVRVDIIGWRGSGALFNDQPPDVVDTKIPRQADKDGVYTWGWAPADEVTFAFYKSGYIPHTKKILPADDIEYFLSRPK